jgi:hypothetical protein
VEKWERDEINRRFKRLEEGAHKTEDRIRAFEWRDGMRVHMNILVLVWIALAAFVVFEVVVGIRG